jgi:HEPN domain-containing protein
VLAKVEKPEEAVWEDLCFNAQQAAEKALKAVLQHKGIVFRYVHDLDEFIIQLEKNGVEVPDDVKQAVRLNRYAFETRYPGYFEPVTEEDHGRALQIAERVFTWAEGVIISGQSTSGKNKHANNSNQSKEQP